MKLVVLTTETTHHAYFIREVQRFYELERVFIETGSVRAPFETHHFFEDIRDNYERSCFFDGETVSIKNLAPVMELENINQKEVIDELGLIEPDLVLVFGTRKLKPDLIDTCPQGFLNLHGGDPEEYRGLDSHLWAIYHDDFSALVTTLHRINAHLDDGAIVSRASIPVHKGMKLHELRRFNTEMCVTLTLNALDMYKRSGSICSAHQRRKGRYYSFMPSPLKDICVRKFERYAEV